jgi:protein SCO1/2
MTSTQKTVFTLLACVALVIGLTVSKVLNNRGQDNQADQLDAGVVLLQQARALPQVELLDQDGETRQLDQLKGKWSLVFFGYTFCPDICPTTLADLRQIQSQLPQATREQLQVVLISVDPQRDTPQQLKQYLGYFDAQFIGLTGTPEAIQASANALGVPYVPGDTSKENYTVDHGGNLALIDPSGVQRGFIRAPLRSQKLIGVLPGILGQR